MPHFDERRNSGPMVMVALCCALGGAPLPADAPILDALNSQAARIQLKAFWAKIDGGKGSLFHLNGELAQQFGMTEGGFQEALFRTECRAAGMPLEGPPMALGNYALASLARFRLDVSTMESRLTYTRMVMPTPSMRVANQLQQIETVDRRLEELSALQRRKTIPTDAFLRAIEGIQREVYRHCVLWIVKIKGQNAE